MNYALAQPRADRHPVGLAIVVGLHVLLAAVMLTARLRTAPLVVAPPPLTRIEPSLPQPPRPHDLPEPPRQMLNQVVAPVPEVVVDRTEPSLRAVPLPAPAAARGPAPTTEQAGPVATDATRAAAHGVHIDAGNQKCRPVYPHVAEREGVEGITKLRIKVDAAGHVTGAEILEPSGKQRQNRNMDQAAIEALSQCPVSSGVDEFGRPVGGAIDINYKWTVL